MYRKKSIGCFIIQIQSTASCSYPNASFSICVKTIGIHTVELSIRSRITWNGIAPFFITMKPKNSMCIGSHPHISVISFGHIHRRNVSHLAISYLQSIQPHRFSIHCTHWNSITRSKPKVVLWVFIDMKNTGTCQPRRILSIIIPHPLCHRRLLIYLINSSVISCNPNMSCYGMLHHRHNRRNTTITVEFRHLSIISEFPGLTILHP